jgi:hypothetical protein
LLASAQPVVLEDVLSRVTAYVGEFIPRYAGVVATERYEQRIRLSAASTQSVADRKLKADILLVQDPSAPQDWLVFRDVLEVDGKVRQQQPDRLVQLFVNPAADATERAAAIAAEGARLHLPGSSTLVTNPLFVLALMQPRYRPSLRFTLGGEERSLGRDVRAIRFEEREETPPLFADLGRVRGSVWAERGTGRIVKTEGRMGRGAATATTTTTFARNERLALTVPQEMRTTWAYTQNVVTARPVNGVATYDDFRRFSVSTDSDLKRP